MTQPVGQSDNVNHLVCLPPDSDGSPDLWTEVHEQVQGQLANLEIETRARVTGVRVDIGRTKGDRFCLFSYRTFSLPGSDIDPVVCGTTCTPAEHGIVIEADVSGEQTGDWILALPSRTVPKSRGELLAAARESTRELCQSADAIAAALKDTSRRVE